MSSDNYNMIFQRSDGKWIMSPNHSMSALMEYEELTAYNYAKQQIRPEDKIFDTQGEAFDASDQEYSEYGTFSHERPKWINDNE